jgi:transcription elongation factor GreA
VSYNSARKQYARRSAEGFGLQRFFHGARAAVAAPRAEAPVNNLEKPVYVSAEGLKKIQHELEELKTVERQKVAERIHAAMEFGDFTENSELEQAKNDQAFLEGRILTLEQMVKNAVTIDEKTHHELVEIGSHVMVEAEGAREQYVIVGSAEAAPAEGRISNESPVGKALMGHRAGETVRLVVPAGAVEMKILAVS